MNGGEYVAKSRKSTVARVEEQKEYRFIFGNWVRQLHNIQGTLRRAVKRKCIVSGKRMYCEQGAKDAIFAMKRYRNTTTYSYRCNHCDAFHLTKQKQ